MFSLVLSAAGCITDIGSPNEKYPNKSVILLEDAQFKYENRMGSDRAGHFNKGQSSALLTWPQKGWNAMCRQPICLLDVNNNGTFTHSAVMNRKTLYKMEVPAKYKLVPVKYKLMDEVAIYEPDDNYAQRKIEKLNIPALKTVNTAEIGQTMFNKINRVIYNKPTLELTESLVSMYENVYSEKAEITFEHSKKYDVKLWSENKAISICTEGVCLIDFNNSGSFTHISPFGFDAKQLLKKPVKYNIDQGTEFNETSFKYLALYQGKIGNKIKISYREFINDMARPAFTQDIEYELNDHEPTVIGFKGLRIKILKATNLNITYSVIKDYEQERQSL